MVTAICWLDVGNGVVDFYIYCFSIWIAPSYASHIFQAPTQFCSKKTVNSIAMPSNIFALAVVFIQHPPPGPSHEQDRGLKSSAHWPLRPSLVIPEILLLVEQIRPTTSQIYNLRTPIPILLQSRTLKAVKRVRNTLQNVSAYAQYSRGYRRRTYLTTANHTLVLVVTKTAFVADANEGCRTNVGVADGAFSVAFVA